MASPRSWPFDDDPTSGWPAPTPIGRWWRSGCGPAWAGRAAPPRRPGGGCGRPSGPPGPGPCPGGSPPILVVGAVWGESSAASWRPAGAGPGRTGRRGGRRDAAVPAQPGRRRLAARRGGGAAHRPTAQPPGATRMGGPARPGRPRQPGRYPLAPCCVSHPPGGARARAGRRSGRPGPGPLPRRRLTLHACRALKWRDSCRRPCPSVVEPHAHLGGRDEPPATVMA